MRPGWRLAGLGLMFLAFFGLLTLRLWVLQVAEGQAYVGRAQTQQIEVFDLPAPRGEIRDRNGVLLAGTRPIPSVVVDRSLIDEEEEPELVQRLATLLELGPGEVTERFDDAGEGARFRLRNDVTSAQALFIREHSEAFPGVTVEMIPERTYPAGSLAAHVVGYIGRPNDDDLERPDIGSEDVVGRFGVEREYDSLLRGVPGKVKFQVDAAANIQSRIGTEPARPGGNAWLTIDAELQAYVEQVLIDAIALARAENEPAIRASMVVLDVRDGSILAMASSPAFEPQAFVGGLTQDEFEALAENGAFNNFTIQGGYPPASTFKAVAYVMALEDDIYPPEVFSDVGTFFCSGRLEFESFDPSIEPQSVTDWLPSGHGDIDLHHALEQSCDVYFWELALQTWRTRQDGGNEQLIQDWARRFGFGRETGVDLPFESAGLVPDRAWFNDMQENFPGRVRDTGGWVGGDVMNVVIGQGDVLATPLQLGNAFAAMVNGGTLWRPRVVDRIEDDEGQVIFENVPTVQNQIEMDPRTLAFLKEDLRRVINGPAGTARKAFETVDVVLRNQMGGKTGTAEVDQARDIDTAWFVGVTPIDNPAFVVSLVVERGGSGGKIAAPAARLVMEYLVAEDAPTAQLQVGEDSD